MMFDVRSMSAADSWRRANLLSRCTGAWRRAVTQSQAEARGHVDKIVLLRMFDKFRRNAKEHHMRDGLVMQELAIAHWERTWLRYFMHSLRNELHQRIQIQESLKYAQRGALMRGLCALHQRVMQKKSISAALAERDIIARGLRSPLRRGLRIWRRRVAGAREMEGKRNVAINFTWHYDCRRTFDKWRSALLHARREKRCIEKLKRHFEVNIKTRRSPENLLLLKFALGRFGGRLTRRCLERLSAVSGYRVASLLDSSQSARNNTKFAVSQLLSLRNTLLRQSQRARDAMSLKMSQGMPRTALRNLIKYAHNRRVRRKIASRPAFRRAVLQLSESRRLRYLFAGLQTLRHFAKWRASLRSGLIPVSFRSDRSSKAVQPLLLHPIRAQSLLKWSLNKIKQSTMHQIHRRGVMLLSGSHVVYRRMGRYFVARFVVNTRSLAQSRSAVLRGIFFWKYFRLLKVMKWFKTYSSARVRRRSEMRAALQRYRKRCSQGVVAAFLQIPASTTATSCASMESKYSVPQSVTDKIWERFVRKLLHSPRVSPERPIAARGVPPSPESVASCEPHSDSVNVPLHKMRPRTSLLELEDLPLRVSSCIVTGASLANSAPDHISRHVDLAHATPRNSSREALPLRDHVIIDAVTPALDVLSRRVDAMLALSARDARGAASEATALRAMISELQASLSEFI